MIRSLLAAALAAVIASAAPAAWNEPHVEGATQHPLLRLYPQARVDEYSQRDFDAADIVVGYKRSEGDPVVTESVEGRVTRYKYEHKPQTSPLEIVRQYEGALKPQGWTVVFAGREAQYHGVPVSGRNGAFGVFRLDRDGAPAVWLNVNAYELNGANDPFSELTIVEIKGMEQKLEANAASMMSALQSAGRVAVYGINFDTGKAVIRPDSEKVLAEVQKLLAQNPGLKVRIEGHTDNVGGSAANKKLSEERANAVRVWLTQKGARAANLTTAGFGDAQPVADNGSDEGRAKNRRVELVRQ